MRHLEHISSELDTLSYTDTAVSILRQNKHQQEKRKKTLTCSAKDLSVMLYLLSGQRCLLFLHDQSQTGEKSQYNVTNHKLSFKLICRIKSTYRSFFLIFCVCPYIVFFKNFLVTIMIMYLT